MQQRTPDPVVLIIVGTDKSKVLWIFLIVSKSLPLFVVNKYGVRNTKLLYAAKIATNAVSDMVEW